MLPQEMGGKRGERWCWMARGVGLLWCWEGRGFGEHQLSGIPEFLVSSSVKHGE